MKWEKEIIIVEDSEIIGRIMAMTIQKMDGFTPKIFKSGEELYAAWDQLNPAGILVDYYLDAEDKASMNGAELTHKVHQLAPDLPIIMMTGSTQKDILDEINSLPIAAFIHKDAEDVLEQIEDLVTRYCQ